MQFADIEIGKNEMVNSKYQERIEHRPEVAKRGIVVLLPEIYQSQLAYYVVVLAPLCGLADCRSVIGCYIRGCGLYVGHYVLTIYVLLFPKRLWEPDLPDSRD